MSSPSTTSNFFKVDQFLEKDKGPSSDIILQTFPIPPIFSQEGEVQETPFASTGLNQRAEPAAAQLLPTLGGCCLAERCWERGVKKKNHPSLKPEKEIASLLWLLRCQLKRNHYKEADTFGGRQRTHPNDPS